MPVKCYSFWFIDSRSLTLRSSISIFKVDSHTVLSFLCVLLAYLQGCWFLLWSFLGWTWSYTNFLVWFTEYFPNFPTIEDKGHCILYFSISIPSWVASTNSVVNCFVTESLKAYLKLFFLLESSMLVSVEIIAKGLVLFSKFLDILLVVFHESVCVGH